MKTKYLFLLSFVALMLSCCAKAPQEASAPVKGKSITLNIIVSELTKATKTKWENGDVINIWFDSNTAPSGSVIKDVDLAITYNGSEWSGTVSDAVSSALKTSGGTLSAVWASTGPVSGWDKDGVNLKTPEASPWMVLTSGIEYDFDGTTLSATLNGWKHATTVQFVVAGLDASHKWVMKSNNICAVSALTLTGDGFTVVKGDAYSAIEGVSNSDGVAFNGVILPGVSGVAGKYTFAIYDETTGQMFSYVNESGTITASETAHASRKAESSKFIENALTGVFEIADGVKARFSRGSLWCNNEDPANPKYYFEKIQYACEPDGAKYNAAHVGLFYWETTGNYGAGDQCVTPVGTSSDTVDWGVAYNAFNGTAGWVTMAASNWGKIMSTCSYAFNVTVCGLTKCVVVYPADYALTKVGNGDLTTYADAADWQKAEDAGAVCLPGAGYRAYDSKLRYSHTNTVGQQECCWLSELWNGQYPYTAKSNGEWFGCYTDTRSTAEVVRLVIPMN